MIQHANQLRNLLDSLLISPQKPRAPSRLVNHRGNLQDNREVFPQDNHRANLQANLQEILLGNPPVSHHVNLLMLPQANLLVGLQVNLLVSLRGSHRVNQQGNQQDNRRGSQQDNRHVNQLGNHLAILQCNHLLAQQLFQ